jgi:poly-gamma-glutamate synthesis protein (capsule biosynthesis protein)
VETYLEEMEQAGAETTVMYIHWGVEYQTYANDQQKAIAQRLCDLGIDVIIGGHAHVVQPMDLLTSTTDPDHKTVCIYSLGNAVSNQRRELMNLSTGHTEDGMLFSVTFSKYSDGTVYVDSTDILPTWVNMHHPGGVKEYNILPLDIETVDDWKTLYNLSDAQYQSSKDSYDRTMAIVGSGLEECQTYLADAKQQRDEAYLAAVQKPAA